MGEAAPCMMRSVSQPLFASCGFKEGDRLRALTTSISFGRFMNEPLDWEKWSSFSHNRTLEDVQKYSRPGAVAEKKAFFEAYFKNFAAKKGAKPPNKENKPPKFSDIDENTNLGFSETTGNVDNIILSTCQLEPSTDTQFMVNDTSNTRGIEPEILVKEVPGLPCTNLVNSDIKNVDGIISNASQEEPSVFSQFVVDDASNTRGLEPEISVKEVTGLPSTNLVYSDIKNVDGIISNDSQVETSVFSQFVEDVSRDEVVEPVLSSNEDVIVGTSLVFSENMNVEENLSSEKHQFQVELTNHVEKNKKTQIKDKISAKTKAEICRVISAQTKAEICRVKSSSSKAPIAAMQDKKAAIDFMEKKKSVHLLIKFPVSPNKNVNLKSLTKVSSVSGVKKDCKVFPILENKRSKPQLNVSKTTILKSLSTKVSSVSGVKKDCKVLPIPENKRSKPQLNGSKTTVLKSFSTNHSEALIASTKKPRFTTVFSSFSFRSDERAAKRKEFSQRLEEKGNTKQLQPKLKEKGRSDNRKLPWATVLPVNSKPNTNGAKLPIDNIQKVQSKLGKKNFIEINKKNLCRSMSCLASNKLHDSTIMLKK